MKRRFEEGAFYQEGMLLESAFLNRPRAPGPDAHKPEDDPSKQPPALLTKEEAYGLILEAATNRANQDDRAAAAAAVIEWAQGGDATWESFDDMAYGLALMSEGYDPADETDIDETDELNDTYNNFLVLMAEAAVMFGATEEDVATFIDEEDDDVAETIMDALSGIDEEEGQDLIATFSVGDNEALFEAVKKVVRNGKVKLIKKKVRPRRMNSAQRAALKKARRKSNTSSARMKRKKSMKIRKKRFGK